MTARVARMPTRFLIQFTHLLAFGGALSAWNRRIYHFRSTPTVLRLVREYLTRSAVPGMAEIRAVVFPALEQLITNH